MKKLVLDMDALEVASFDTAADAAARRGTVQGNERTMMCTGGYRTLCESFCDASLMYTDCIATSQ
jgi:hypothetical protein